MKDLEDRKKELENDVLFIKNKMQGLQNEMNENATELVKLQGRFEEIDYIIEHFSEEEDKEDVKPE